MMKTSRRIKWFSRLAVHSSEMFLVAILTRTLSFTWPEGCEVHWSQVPLPQNAPALLQFSTILPSHETTSGWWWHPRGKIRAERSLCSNSNFSACGHVPVEMMNALATAEDFSSRTSSIIESMASLQLRETCSDMVGLWWVWGTCGERARGLSGFLSWWSAIIVRNFKLFMDLLYLLSTFLGHSFVYKTVFTLTSFHFWNMKFSIISFLHCKKRHTYSGLIHHPRWIFCLIILVNTVNSSLIYI